MKSTHCAIILGGNGLIGYSTAKYLSEIGWRIKSFDRTEISELYRLKNVEYIVSDLYDEKNLIKSFDSVDVVFDLISTTIPKTNDSFLKAEIEKSLTMLDYILRTMVDTNINHFVFPSSGGAIYGNVASGYASEELCNIPTTAYGMGKYLSEKIINFYSLKYNVRSEVLRIGNVYGSPIFRDLQQGVIDVFVQKALMNESITIWGNAESVIRDYVFIDDLTYAMEKVVSADLSGYNVYNVGTGVGVSVKDIIVQIEKNIEKIINIIYLPKSISNINRIILNTSKIEDVIGYKPSTLISEGIKKTIAIKKQILGL